jgi:UDP-glucose:tetrahydrobiopterin glucosyltransferase
VRIALIAPLVAPIREPNLGGAQVVVADLARGLSRRGHDVVVYAAMGSVTEGVVMESLDIDSTALAGDRIRPGAEPNASPAMVAAYRAVYADVSARGFDAVHNHGFDAPAISIAADSGVAVLHTLHLPPSAAVVTALGAARAKGPVWCATVSAAQESAWGAFTAVDAVLRNGVPVDSIPFNAERGTGVVIAARFSAEKGIDEGITAARAAGHSVDVYGTPYDAAHEGSVRLRWCDDAQVCFHAPLERTALWDVLGRAAVTVCLSRWDEPFGMVAAEAQAAGTPVVAAARGGLPEVVRDGVTGFLVDPGDARAAAAAVERARRVDRGACRRQAVECLNLNAAISAHEDMYARIAAH